MPFQKWDVRIADIIPCEDILVFAVQEIDEVNKETRPGYEYLLCLDARDFRCAPDRLSQITFWDNWDEHNIIIGEIGEGEEKERLAFLRLKECPPHSSNEDKELPLMGTIKGSKIL